MAQLQLPALVWQDHAGVFTAALVDPGAFPESDDLSACAAGEPEALAGLQRAVRRELKRGARFDPLSLEQPRLDHLRVDIRPELTAVDVKYLSPDPIGLRVACVHGRERAGLRLCSLPLLGILFRYHDGERLKELVEREVRGLLRGLSPGELAEYFPPRSTALRSVAVQPPRARRDGGDAPDTPTLTLVADRVSRRDRRRERAWERDSEVEELARRLAERRASVLLVGEHGVGKSTVLREAVARLEREAGADEEHPWRGRSVWVTAAPRVIAGMRFMGEWQGRCESIVHELRGCGGVLAFDCLVELLRTGGSSATGSIGAFLQSYLERGELQLVAECTPAQLVACRRALPRLLEVMQVLRLEPLDRLRTTRVLARLAESHRRNDRMDAEQGIPDTVMDLFARFAPYDAMPGSAAAFLERLFDEAQRAGVDTVESESAVRRFSRRSGLPDSILRDDVPLSADDVAAALAEQVVGQEEACRAAASVVTTFKAGLNDPERPLGVLLFCGPTGVGKTQLARALAGYLFGHERRLVRLDMSELTGPGATARLLGGPGGEPSELSRSMRRQPFAVVLLDEIEKADSDVLDALMGMLDEGRLTDELGDVTSFKSAILILTSNLGAEAPDAPGFSPAGRTAYEAEAMAAFRPEFYNRIDRVVSFAPLDRDACEAIARKELAAIGEREGLRDAGLELFYTPGLVERVVEVGFDARYGARPLQRTLEQLVVAPLARLLVEEPGLQERRILVDVDDEGEVRLQF